MQLKNNCTSNSRVNARGEAECNFYCYEYNYSLIARKYIVVIITHYNACYVISIDTAFQSMKVRLKISIKIIIIKC